MAAFANGSKALGLCRKCGLRFRLNDLVLDEQWPGLRVCVGCFDSRHPQERPLRDIADPQALWRPSPWSKSITPPVLSIDDGGGLEWTAPTFTGSYDITGYRVEEAAIGSNVFVEVWSDRRDLRDIDSPPAELETYSHAVSNGQHQYRVAVEFLNDPDVYSNTVVIGGQG